MTKWLPITLSSVALVSCATAPEAFPSKSDKKGQNVPSLTSPEVRRIWVPEKIEGNKFFDGHYMYVIDKPSVWSK